MKLQIVGAHGAGAKQYVHATLPPPRETPQLLEIAVVASKTPPSKVKPGRTTVLRVPTAILKYKRGGTEAAIPWAQGKAHKLRFAGNKLPCKIQALDGSDAKPTASLKGSVLTIASVQQGDVLIVEHKSSKARAQVTVVKNFSWNDLQRRSGKLAGITRYRGFPQAVQTNIINTIKFVLDPRPTSQQAKQRKKLTQLSIPSAYGVGIFPDDTSHLHFYLPVRAPPVAVRQALSKRQAKQQASLKATKVNALGLKRENPAARKRVIAFQKAMMADVAAVATVVAQQSGAFSVYHSYEIVDARYYDPTQRWSSGMSSQDPIRHIKTPLTSNRPELFDPKKNHTPATSREVSLAGFSFFVGRRGDLVPYEGCGFIAAFGARSLQIADALGEI